MIASPHLHGQVSCHRLQKSPNGASSIPGEIRKRGRNTQSRRPCYRSPTLTPSALMALRKGRTASVYLAFTSDSSMEVFPYRTRRAEGPDAMDLVPHTPIPSLTTVSARSLPLAAGVAKDACIVSSPHLLPCHLIARGIASPSFFASSSSFSLSRPLEDRVVVNQARFQASSTVPASIPLAAPTAMSLHSTSNVAEHWGVVVAVSVPPSLVSRVWAGALFAFNCRLLFRVGFSRCTLHQSRGTASTASVFEVGAVFLHANAQHLPRVRAYMRFV